MNYYIKTMEIYLKCPAIRDPIRAYFINNLPAMFYVFNYRGPLAVYGKFVNVTATFTWSFTDLFVILVSKLEFTSLNHSSYLKSFCVHLRVYRAIVNI